MRELILRVQREAVEDVLDRLLVIAPDGVREVPDGSEVELRLRGADLPSMADVATAAAQWPHVLSERTVPEDWRERRRFDYRPEVIGDRLVVRPDWAPPTDRAEIEIVLSAVEAFGAGTHPTTRACLELLLELPPRGSFADLGCGTGVLAILAARLGFEPVVALDASPESVAAAHAHARANKVEIEARLADLNEERPPSADAIAANVPVDLHQRIAATLPEPLPRRAIVSGFGPYEADAALSGYRSRGLGVAHRIEAGGWVVVRLERDLRPAER